MLGPVELTEELRRIAEAAVRFADPGEELAGIVPTEPDGSRAYLCAYERGGATRWLVLESDGKAIDDRERVRAAVSIATLVELAEDVAAGGDLDELRSQLVALRVTENPAGIDEAEAAAHELQAMIGATPRLASPARLDAVGAATLRLERALGSDTASPFATAMKQAPATVDGLTRDVEAAYKVPLRG
jgi:hypothetical protein